VRFCRSSAVDSATRKPTTAAFTFRQKPDGSWDDTYLSVFWLELLDGHAETPQGQLATFRQYAANNPPFPVPKLSANGVLAVLPVSVIHSANLLTAPTELQCAHEPGGDGDPHSGVHPVPGVQSWPTVGESPAHLAVRQFLLESMSHFEDAVLKPKV
jgi:hypothetical protein